MDDTGSLEIRWIQGFTGKSITFVDNKTACYPCGSCISFLNLETKAQSVLQSPGRGVGAFTANANNGIFAFSEQKLCPSIFVYVFKELHLKNELKGGAQLDYTSLTLSDGGPYLGCCSSLPEYTITVWNWENAEQICSKPNAGQGVVSLLFNPLNCLQLCAQSTAGLTVWNIEKSGSFHDLRPSVINLPATDGSFVEGLTATFHAANEKIPYFGPEMPPSAITGLHGDKAESIVTKLCTKARLTPTAICWTAKSGLYVGCAEGFLLLVDPESLSVSILFNPTNTSPELRRIGFQGLTLNKTGLTAIGKECVVHCLQFKETQINITQTWQLGDPVTTVMHSPDYETLLVPSNTGQIYKLNPTSDEVVKILDVLSGNFVAAAVSHTDRNICVSVRESGNLQLWSTDGLCLGSLSLQTEVTSLACCPVAQYAAVGTSSGYVLFIDLNRELQPRLVHQVHLYHCPVNHLVFDKEGHYLFTGGSDSHIYVLDAKPSQRFSVMGYTVVSGPILSLSAQNIRTSKQVKVLALCSGEEGRHQNGNLLTVLTLPTGDLSDCVDKHDCLSTSILKVSRYEVPHPLVSCVLGISEVFAYCHKRKTHQRFQLPQDTDGPSSKEVVQLKPEQEVKGHPLGPASVALSPHNLWLASVGRDGLLLIRETASMEKYIELHCHSSRLDGVRSVSFSADSQSLLTAGYKDASLLCINLRDKGLNAGKLNEATQYSKSMDHLLKDIFSKENDVLIDMPEWGQESIPCSDKPQESEISAEEAETVEVTEQDESYNSLLSAPPSHLTWLESRREAALKEENEQYSEAKKSMRKTIKELRDTIQDMIRENETLPDIERLELHEFNLDIEEQKRLEAMVQQEVIKVRSEVEWEMLAKCYLRDVLKKECWDSMKVKGKAIRAFHSEHEVKNYPLRERTEEEEEDLRRVQDIRKFEKAACTQRSLEKCSKTPGAKEEEQGEEGRGAESAAVSGSFSAELGYSDPHIYDQFSLQTTEQRINQMILLQDLIYRIKTGFNADFETVHRQKVQELSRARERNRQIREIMLELDMNETLLEPTLTVSECPERLLTVEDSEIKAEKYLTPEQREEEERKKLEEQKRLAAKGDSLRERALDDMMDGALEVKKENILKVEIPPPEFVLTKPSIHWTEEERRVHKEYENKAKDLSEEKEKYRKSMGTEIKKLQAVTKDATERFDGTVKQLFEKKIKCEMTVYQEELKITYLAYSVLIEEEMRNRELELKLKLEKTVAFKDEIGEQLKKHEEEVELFHENYSTIVVDDKSLDKDFRKEFFNVPGHVVDKLYKLFKRRPRVQKMRTQTANNTNPFKEQRLCGSLAPDALGKMLKAMEELDAPENMPEGLNRSIWEKFCLVRRMKVESEQKVKLNALTLAEMQAFLQKRRDEDKAAHQEIKNLSDELERLHRQKNRFLMDTMVQVLLKPDQVEVAVADMTADYTDSVLYPKSVVEDLNRTIRTLGGQKIASMVECKDFRKGIIQLQWEHRWLTMQIEDLNNKKRDIQKLKLTKEQQDYLDNADQDSRVSKQVSSLEKTVAFQEKTHLQSVQHRKKMIDQLKRQAALKVKKSGVVEQRLPDMQVAVAERRLVYEEIAPEESQAASTEERYQEVVQRSRLKDLVKAQEEDLTLLWAEVDCLRRKNFPSLDQLKHT
ncbi:cilia- and flagella-associated protein 43 isoform X3 [Notolabrus celidotus]|uniref:cilia- and flagella-associated protein 43 isoform X3 n=1 Tax=Notolabrus celidotus TaxID=1203425 RepID=UPI00149056CD|nr:cilia- and flagella-associated protein 43 isoform X3 [Notolabrus celidotus]